MRRTLLLVGVLGLATASGTRPATAGPGFLGDGRCGNPTCHGAGLPSREKPDVLISDLGLPDHDGYELIRAIRELPPEQGGNIPAAALSAFARSEDRTKALRSGFEMHLAKPVDPGELVASVATLVRRARSAR